MTTLYKIGEFSQITGLSIKTLRFYHEKGLLVPTAIDEATGYRFYGAEKVEKARVISRLRAMDVAVEVIAEILAECDDESDMLNFLERQRAILERRIEKDKGNLRAFNDIIATEQAAKKLLEGETYAVKEALLKPMLVAGIRMKGAYSDCGEQFSRLAKAVGRYISGKALCLYYDGEYREDDADFEPCFPVRKAIEVDGVSVRELAGGNCLTLVHRGPYNQLGWSYRRILGYANDRGLSITLPTREVYLKGPGMIFKGRPKNYLTEIQLPVNG